MLNTNAGVFRHGLELNLPDGDFPTTGWVVEPCKVQGYVFKDDFNSGFRLPECLLVFKRASHLAKPTGEFYSTVGEWMTNSNVKRPGPTYEVVYSRYATNSYGQLRAWIPVESVANEAAVIAWAQQLPEVLKNLFEKRSLNANLPQIPNNY